MLYFLQTSLRAKRSNLLFFIIFWVIPAMPSMAQTQQLSNMTFYQQQTQLHQELSAAIKSGNKQQANQLRAQLITLQKQQFSQRKQLIDQMRAAIKSGDKQTAEQLREQLMTVNPQGMGLGRGALMVRDPQETSLVQKLHDANKAGDKQKADQIRAQLNALHKQHFAQRKQLFDQMRAAVKSGDKQKIEQMREQVLSTPF